MKLTNKQALKKWLDSVGVTYSEDAIHHSEMITIKARHDKKVSGFQGFETQFTFHERTGKFIDIQIWE